MLDYFLKCCEPTIIKCEQEAEEFGEVSNNYIYNCEGCEDKDCEYWQDYNEEIQNASNNNIKK